MSTSAGEELDAHIAGYVEGGVHYLTHAEHIEKRVREDLVRDVLDTIQYEHSLTCDPNFYGEGEKVYNIKLSAWVGVIQFTLDPRNELVWAPYDNWWEQINSQYPFGESGD